jgi:hypothetical protein
MIKQTVVKKFQREVIGSVEEAFAFAERHEKSPGDFLLFLENGHRTDTPFPGMSPFVIGQGRRGLADNSRREFIDFYLNLPFEATYKRARKKERREAIYKNSLHMDLMIYSHSWESNPNLRMLRRLAVVANSDLYDWDIKVPDFTKHDFIRNDVRSVFTKHGLHIGDIVTRAFHSQLRNAFAHSDYDFWSPGKILLNNYKGEAWQLESISYDEWDERFTLTILLFNVMEWAVSRAKARIGPTKRSHAVWIPYGWGDKLNYLYYDRYWNRFLWEKNRSKDDETT